MREAAQRIGVAIRLQELAARIGTLLRIVVNAHPQLGILRLQWRVDQIAGYQTRIKEDSEKLAAMKQSNQILRTGEDESNTIVMERLSPAAGSEFAVLKPDNATGNFIKVPQRLGVRIAIDPDQRLADRLRPGMSVEASVDTHRAP